MPHVVSLALQEWVHNLRLINCSNIKDVNNLGSVHTLSLNGCYKIKDVNNLHSVNTLNLIKCNGIKDISNLHSVDTLNLYQCKKIKDVGNLRKLKKIIINEKVYGLHLLRGLEELIIITELCKEMKGEIIKLIPKKILIFRNISRNLQFL